MNWQDSPQLRLTDISHLILLIELKLTRLSSISNLIQCSRKCEQGVISLFNLHDLPRLCK